MGEPISARGALNRFVGVMLIAAGVLVLASALLVPVPSFHDLHPRAGTLMEASRERFSPCRRGDCTRTMVTVRHPDGVHRYHFADADVAALEEGAPIAVWTYPEFRGFDRRRVWHAVQGGRVIRDHAVLSASDRRIRIGLLLLTPALLIGGGWISRHYDWDGRSAGR